MAKVTVIIPVFNVEPYLVECMNSVVKQTLKDLEIICINDGSTDNSLAILKGYAAKDERIIIVDKENGGYGMGMNIGLDKATGEYIGIVEPDDFIPINMYEDLYDVVSKNNLDFVKADFYRFTREENGNMNLVYNHLDSTNTKYNTLLNTSEDTSCIRFIMNTWSGIYKREFIEKFHIRHNETPGASFQDNGFYFQTFIYATRAMILDKPYYMNRRDNPNSSVNSSEKVYCMNVEYDHIRDILMKDKELWNRFKYMYSLRKYHNYMFTIRRIADEFKLEYIQRIAAEFKRARENNELEQSVFSASDWSNISFMIANPEAYYTKNILSSARERKLEKQLKNLQSSTTFKIGKIILFIPKGIKRLFVKG